MIIMTEMMMVVVMNMMMMMMRVVVFATAVDVMTIDDYVAAALNLHRCDSQVPQMGVNPPAQNL